MLYNGAEISEVEAVKILKEALTDITSYNIEDIYDANLYLKLDLRVITTLLTSLKELNKEEMFEILLMELKVRNMTYMVDVIYYLAKLKPSKEKYPRLRRYAELRDGDIEVLWNNVIRFRSNMNVLDNISSFMTKLGYAKNTSNEYILSMNEDEEQKHKIRINNVLSYFKFDEEEVFTSVINRIKEDFKEVSRVEEEDLDNLNNLGFNIMEFKDMMFDSLSYLIKIYEYDFLLVLYKGNFSLFVSEDTDKEIYIKTLNYLSDRFIDMSNDLLEMGSKNLVFKTNINEDLKTILNLYGLNYRVVNNKDRLMDLIFDIDLKNLLPFYNTRYLILDVYSKDLNFILIYDNKEKRLVKVLQEENRFITTIREDLEKLLK